MTARIYALTTTGNGLDVLHLLPASFPLTGVITLGVRSSSPKLANLAHPGQFCEAAGLECIEVQDYSLSSAADRDRLLATDIDVLLAIGWQRLVPDWLIDHCRIAVLGVHGSAGGITAGRGRSPQNWALMMGKPEFEVSLFFVEAGIDSGAVIDSRQFALTPWDDIGTSHLKVSVATVEMLAGAWSRGDIQGRRGREQTGEARYLPQRTPDDGLVDWTGPAMRVCNFVRALTRPYPGAFAFLQQRRINLWTVIPFGMPWPKPAQPGEVLGVSHDRQLIVMAGDGPVLVRDWDCTGDPGFIPTPGCVLTGTLLSNQIQSIVSRHQARYPDLPVSEDVLALASKEKNVQS